LTTRIVFLGSPAFAVPAIESLAVDPRFEIVLVVTQPDRPAGRGRRLTAPPIKEAARNRGLPVLQPETLRDAGAVDQLRRASPDLLVVVAYGEFLSRQVLGTAEHGAVNAHPSLLPKYRGASPIPTAILNGDEMTGVSLIKLTSRLDAGPVIAQEPLRIEQGETAGQLSVRLAKLTAEILPDVCHGWVSGELTTAPQDETLATYTREWSRDDARIDWTRSAAEIERLIRAAQPWPVAWTTVGDASLLIHAASVVDDQHSGEPGLARLSDNRLLVTCGVGTLRVEIVQPASRQRMPALDWWRGLHLPYTLFDR
jgi:methionyl-tRNA formyltransferase